MSVAEVQSLPWWEHEMLLNGMRTEFAPRDDEPAATSSGHVPVSLSDLGITPQRVT